tara:strand:- start:1271 stop:1483 length:213 start_codon:yes stop_codon:yes gene_type:complete
LNLGFVLLITYKRPRLRTTLQSGCLFFKVLIEDATFMIPHNTSVSIIVNLERIWDGNILIAKKNYYFNLF